jgi:electron transfer flavoprotein alpha subunit
MADRLGAGLGCSRPLTEAVDWFPREVYIGITGQMLTPRVYVGLGISGQIQHMVGVNRADKIIAINKDRNAPIFKQCDLGIVGDIAVVLPELIDALER